MTGIGLDSPIEAVLGSRKTDKGNATALEKNLGLRTVGDLLWHFPRDYLKTGEVSTVTGLEDGQPLTVVATVLGTEVKEFFNRRTQKMAARLEATIKTDGPVLTLTIFARHRGAAEWHERRLRPGAVGVFTGKVSSFRNRWQLANPQMIMIDDDPDDAASESALALAHGLKALFPIYRVTGKVQTWDLARVISFALTVIDDVPDSFPPHLRERFGVVDTGTALRWIHSPDDHGQVATARKRFKFEEALVTQVVMARRRAAIRTLGAAPRTGGGGLLAEFDARLPFDRTQGQREIGAVLEEELARAWPMSRLLQGEVGSGKTLVALRAMLRVVDSGGQAALLAPTEVLAQQHYRSISTMMGDLAAGGMLGGSADGTTIALLTGSMTKAQRAEAMSRMVTGEAGIVIGTHALLEDHVEFFDLGMVVVDEQHRFGVEQRSRLTDKAGEPPHVLVMTATPIPRTVAMTVFGDLEISTLRELPAGRAPIQTNVVAIAEQPHWIDRAWERVREEVDRGHQVYVVCPRIEETATDDVPDASSAGAAVEVIAPDLAAGALAGLRVEKLHGRMAPEEKDRVMRDFASGEIDVLVSTTVIEVGVDVANATMMVILDADRFGISQLHQLRGRIGRGGLPGLCLLVSASEAGSASRERLTVVAATTDGFELSRADLQQRSEGDVLGEDQSGRRSGLEHLKVVKDEKIIVAARDAAEELVAEDSTLSGSPLLAAKVDALEQDSKS
ncbi:MAG: ATP-dependent DNA helicase RecG, partial [Nocardioides sp.]|nr:ATP-dependent DNA helicase RecG [Nocardioides sp.]